MLSAMEAARLINEGAAVFVVLSFVQMRSVSRLPRQSLSRVVKGGFMAIHNGKLYLIEASDGSHVEMCAVYESSEHNAKTSAATWLSARPHLPLVTVRDFPGGFAMYFQDNHWFSFPGTFGIPITGDDNASRGAPTNNAAEGGNNGK